MRLQLRCVPCGDGRCGGGAGRLVHRLSNRKQRLRTTNATVFFVTRTLEVVAIED